MKFRFLDSVISDLVINLEVLTKDTNLYTSLLFQHSGTFISKASKFGNANDCSNKFNSFLSVAKNKSVSLALTPEYSCPWASIEWMLDNEDRWPNPSKLWAICCESITPDEITAFQKKYNKGNILVYFDVSALSNGGSGVLLDPLCYIFKASQNGIEKICIIIQFKTQHMGVWGDSSERDKYIFGNDVYILRNSRNSIYLFTNICSEAASFSITTTFQNEVDYRWDENPYIILNLQMNPKPTHDVFKSFRKNILTYNNKDIISLNWCRNTIYFETKRPLISESKSSIIFKTDDIDFENETEFIHNHNFGLYYIFKKPKTHIFYLNPNIEVFLITNQKPSSAGSNESMIRRTGPKGSELFYWDNSRNTFNETKNVDDGFSEFLDGLNCFTNSLRNTDINFIDKERLVNLSSGQVITKHDDKRWHKINKLISFTQDDNEAVQRLTYVYDETSKTKRTNYIETMEFLNTKILPIQTLYPSTLSTFMNNCTEVMFSRNDNYKFNLVTKDGKNKATVAYIGRSDNSTATKIFQKLQNLFESTDQSKKRVVVWYNEKLTVITSVFDSAQPTINDDSTIEPNSIF